jgi:hypothetical protein
MYRPAKRTDTKLTLLEQTDTAFSFFDVVPIHLESHEAPA